MTARAHRTVSQLARFRQMEEQRADIALQAARRALEQATQARTQAGERLESIAATRASALQEGRGDLARWRDLLAYELDASERHEAMDEIHSGRVTETHVAESASIAAHASVRVAGRRAARISAELRLQDERRISDLLADQWTAQRGARR